MKKLFTAIALTALIASPALAKSANHDKAQSARSSSAQAQQSQRLASNVVIADGRVVGADPDARIRATLSRDHYTW